MKSGPAILIAVMLALLAAAGIVFYVGWTLESDVTMSVHGYIALVLGVVFSLAVGCGLMALVFYSSRKGYDDAAGHSNARDDGGRGR